MRLHPPPEQGVVTFGEAMIRLNPPGFQRIEQATQMELQPGGAELNVAVALARLGASVRWVSILPDNPLGKWLANQARLHQVDLSHLLWSSSGRMGLYFMERGASPRSSEVIYDRRGSAFAEVSAEVFSWPSILAGAKVFYTSGITPALGSGPRQAVQEALHTAMSLKIITAFDTNYRSKLWSPQEARRTLEALLPLVDYLLSSPSDLNTLFGFSGEPAEIAEQAQRRFNFKGVALSLRGKSPEGALWRDSLVLTDRFYPGTRYTFELVDPLGSGDAFTAGFLYGLLVDDILLGQRIGDILATVKQTIPGDFLWMSREEVEGYFSGEMPPLNR